MNITQSISVTYFSEAQEHVLGILQDLGVGHAFDF